MKRTDRRARWARRCGETGRWCYRPGKCTSQTGWPSRCTAVADTPLPSLCRRSTVNTAQRYQHDVETETVYTAAVYVIPTLSARQPITDQYMPGAGEKGAHAQLCTAPCLPFETRRRPSCFLNFVVLWLELRLAIGLGLGYTVASIHRQVVWVRALLPKNIQDLTALVW